MEPSAGTIEGGADVLSKAAEKVHQMRKALGSNDRQFARMTTTQWKSIQSEFELRPGSPGPGESGVVPGPDLRVLRAHHQRT